MRVTHGPGDQFQSPSFTVAVGSKGTSYEKWEIAMGVRCDICRKPFKLKKAKRRRKGDCKCKKTSQS